MVYNNGGVARSPEDSVPSISSLPEKLSFTVQTTDNNPSLLNDATIADRWKAACDSSGQNVTNADDAIISHFLATNREKHNLKTFCAVDSNDNGDSRLLGFLHCHPCCNFGLRQCNSTQLHCGWWCLLCCSVISNAPFHVQNQVLSDCKTGSRSQEAKSNPKCPPSHRKCSQSFGGKHFR